MTSPTDMTYEVLISIDLPDAGERATVQLILAPEATLELLGGEAKKLRDCTLADLQQYAAVLTAEVWQAYAGIQLGNLASNAESKLVVAIHGKDGELMDLPADVLDHVLVPDTLAELGLAADAALGAEVGELAVEPELDEELAQEDGDDASENETAEPNRQRTLEDLAAATESSQMPDGSAEEAVEAHVAAEDAPASEPAVEAMESPPVGEGPADGEVMAEPEPDIRVSEPEQAIEEREAPVTPMPALPAGPIRILGKRRPQGHPTWTAVDILVNEPAFRDAQAHAVSSPDKEVAGVLIGPPPEKQPDGRYLVHVTDIIIALHTRMAGASVTYTPESWRYVNDRLGELYPDGDAVIVGWYHTHPGFGIFLSGMDQFIHQNFFTQIWHVALVLDPRSRQTGFFCWDRAKSRVDRYEFPWPWWARNAW